MVVVYNSDERFSSVFATSVLSLFESNKDADEITVYLIENGVSEESKAKFREIAEEYHRQIVILPMPDLEKLAGVKIVIPKYNRMATYGRLFIASCLPRDIDKVIYADCDTIFVDSIAGLWGTDISDYQIGMVNDAQSSGHREILGIPAEGIYFNSGIMLVNLKRWREEGLERAFVDYIRSRGGYVPIPDQGVLNAVCDGNILCLSLKYNVFSILYAMDYETVMKVRCPQTFYSKEETEAALREPAIVHFVTNVFMPIRPWVKCCTHPYAEKYLEYRNMTPWKDEPLWEDRTPKLRKLYYRFFRNTPKPVAIWVTQMIYVYLIPLWHRYKKWKHIRSTNKRWGGGTAPNKLQRTYSCCMPYVHPGTLRCF